MNMAGIVYLAGKIYKNDWRQLIVPGIRNVAQSAEGIIAATYMRTSISEDLFTCGPYFISCDHGHFHGDNTHGVSKECCCGTGIDQQIVTKVCEAQIKKCNFMFAYIENETCYGTLCEIGYAVSRSIPVAIMFASQTAEREMWFAKEMANIVFSSDGKLARTDVEDPYINISAVKIAEKLKEVTKKNGHTSSDHR